MNRTSFVTLLTVPLVALGGLAAATTAGAAPTTTSTAETAAAASPLRITTPRLVEGYRSGTRVDFDPGVRVIAEGAPFEVWSKRTTYGAPIVTTWHHGSDVVALPRGTVKNFGELPAFLRLDFRQSGALLATRYRPVCLNSWSTERVRPEAPLRSPYPQYCTNSRITLGSVMGVQEGFASRLETYGSIRLRPGRYQVTTRITLKYRRLFGISAADGTSTFTLRVRDGSSEDGGYRRRTAEQPLRPAASEPTRLAAGRAAGPMPDLRSVPAFGIRIDRSNGNFLQFSGTVWNAGNSPLVVDGFRRESEDVMDAYQYFLDGDGNQVGYQRVGTMEWDAKDSHLHWHFRDFARYRLLNADKQAIVRSRKEAFCLANTDAIDYTVDGADWQPESTDLHTACGEKDSLSIREVLASGSGDTYAQFRAGQSFNLRGLPNGIYYISVEANPRHNLAESDTGNNIAYRKVQIGGRLGARTVKVYPMTAS